MDHYEKGRLVISLDTNLLFFSYAEDRTEHQRAINFVDELAPRGDVLVSELALVELYRLLRNPAVLKKPLNAPEAADVIQTWRNHPRWQILGFPPESKRLHHELWQFVRTPGISSRRIFDARFALVLRHFGVTEFATANVKDFQGFGFQRVWNPLLEE